jgi:hypothetical protein
MKKYPIILLLAGLLSILSCQFFVSATNINDHIDPNVRAEIAQIDKKLFDAFYAKDVKSVKQLMSKGLLDSAGSNIDTIVAKVGSTIRTKSFTVVDEFYTTNAAVGGGVTLMANKGNVNDYTIQYKALNSKMYAVLLKSEGMPINLAILAIYGKYDDGWKVNILSANNYDVLDKTAPEYYALALEKYRKGDTIDACSNIIIASQIANPGGEHFSYNDENDMKNFYNSTIAEANSTYHFPITVRQVKTQPQIFAVTPQFIGETAHRGIFPIVKYKSSIDLKDTVALKAENLALQKVIGTIFKGITEDKKYIVYHAFNQVPDGKTMGNRYGFIQQLP